MATWDITGVWIGEYSYLPSEAYPELASPTKFTLDVSRGCLGRFRGTAQDHLPDGGLRDATIVGRVANTKVTFLKQYPTCYIAHGNQTLTLREHLELEHGVMSDHEAQSEPIRYVGVYDPDQQVVSGTWQIRGGPVKFMSQGRILQLEIQDAAGIWTMRKQW